MTIEKVALVHHTGHADAVAVREDVAGFLTGAGLEVTEEEPDLVVSLGGDGTMLRAARLAHAADAPLLGANLGSLGYLTEIDAHEIRNALETVLDGRHRTEDRMMLECTTDDLALPDVYVGLNEVLVERASRHRLVHLVVRIGGEHLAAVNADGMIVATPTGSTAYALSAGGPIVSPRARCMIVVPVSAHMLVSRAFVLAPDETVEIEVAGRDDEAAVSLDGGWGGEIHPGTKVTVRQHERSLKLVRLGGPGFLERLRSKLGLPG
jgi:NAD+ kinase